jgi:hypothetical protein
VGWLPRRWQRRYAEWRSGISYAYTRLLSTREAREMLSRNTSFDCEFLVPAIPEEDIAIAAPRRAILARTYNRAIKLGVLRRAALGVGAFYQVAGRKIDTRGVEALTISAGLLTLF